MTKKQIKEELALERTLDEFIPPGRELTEDPPGNEFFTEGPDGGLLTIFKCPSCGQDNWALTEAGYRICVVCGKKW